MKKLTINYFLLKQLELEKDNKELDIQIYLEKIYRYPFKGKNYILNNPIFLKLMAYYYIE
jgi:hypothetical protein